MKCLRCGNEMTKGMIIDGHLRQIDWVEGEEKPTVEIGILPPRMEVSVDRYKVVAYRCPSCGYLESFATLTPEGPEKKKRESA